MSNLLHYMVDIETLGLAHNAAIWQAAVVPFALTSRGAALFGAEHAFSPALNAYMNPHQVADLWEKGKLDVNNGTCQWQDQQPNRRVWQWWAQQCIAVPVGIRDTAHAEVKEYPHEAGLDAQANFTIEMLHAWFTARVEAAAQQGKTAHFWSKGKDFEMKVLASSFEAVGLRSPWQYYRFHCVRDFVAYPWLLDGTEPPRNSARTHNAWDDCEDQIALMNAALQLKGIPQ